MKGKPLPKRKPSTVRFYMDADVLGLAKVISKIRPDVTYPGDPGGQIRRRVRSPCPITDTETTDLIWIPQVAAALYSRPRKTLNWKTPTETLNEHLHSLKQGTVATTP